MPLAAVLVAKFGPVTDTDVALAVDQVRVVAPGAGEVVGLALRFAVTVGAALTMNVAVSVTGPPLLSAVIV